MSMVTIKTRYRKVGQYNILETLSFGYRLSILSEIPPLPDGKLTYDPDKAYLQVNKNGYIQLYITQ